MHVTSTFTDASSFQTYVTMNQHPTYRSKDNFSNPDAFIPERFLAPSAGDDLYAFQPFQMGRHSCIGQALAYAEMRIVLARLLYAFDFELADPNDVWDWGSQKTFIFWEKEPLKVLVRPVIR
jgi:cytochrome P450